MKLSELKIRWGQVPPGAFSVAPRPPRGPTWDVVLGEKLYGLCSQVHMGWFPSSRGRQGCWVQPPSPTTPKEKGPFSTFLPTVLLKPPTETTSKHWLHERPWGILPEKGQVHVSQGQQRKWGSWTEPPDRQRPLGHDSAGSDSWASYLSNLSLENQLLLKHIKKKKKLLIGRHWSVAQSWISQRPDNRQLHKHTASLQDFHDQGAWTQTALNAFSGREKEARGCFQDDAIVTALFPRVQHGLLCLVALKYYTVNTEKTQKFCDVQKQSHIIDTKVAKLRDYNTTIWVLGPLTSSTRPTPPARPRPLGTRLSRTSRSHRTPSRRPSRCTRRRCAGTGWWPRRCPPARAWPPAPAVPAPSSAESPSG